MDPKQIKQILIPVTAFAAVLLVIAVIVGAFEKPGGSAGSQGSTSKGKTPVTGDDSRDGMVAEKPSNDAAEWKLQPNRLKIWDVKEGTGEPVAKGQQIVMHYTGWLASNGTRFDASFGKPLDMPLKTGPGGLITGWVEGIPGMRVGGVRRIYIPGDMAYGKRGFPPDIPADADLVFEMKLISFE